MQLSILVNKTFCQSFRSILEETKTFDKNRKVTVKNNDVAVIPILSNPDDCLLKILKEICDFDIQSSSPSNLYKKKSPKDKLANIITETVNISLNTDLTAQIPQSWELYGDLLLLPDYAFSDPIWKSQMPKISQALSSFFGVKRIAKKFLVFDDDYRSPRTEILHGSDPWVTKKENGITYHFDITKSMFCAGNISEKLRVASFDCSGETVVDLFAGIGYFTLPYLVHANADYVYACEWNPSSVIALKLSLKKLNLQERCSVLEGDNRIVCPKNVADRVNLGLIPSSKDSWKTACEALKDSGGILHIHGNIEVHKQENKLDQMKLWSESTRFDFQKLLAEVKSYIDWKTEVIHTECVKSYGPRVYHIVLDLKCSPVSGAQCKIIC